MPDVPTETALPGMGAIPHSSGVAFRVWTPHSSAVSVIGSFNDWNPAANPLRREPDCDLWYGDVPNAKIGDEYRFHLTTPAGELKRIDPYAREVTNSIGNGVIHDPNYDWGKAEFIMPPWNELVIYELHVGTFNTPAGEEDRPGTFEDMAERFGHFKKLGVNAIQIMPIAEFPGDRSWGYNPSHIFAVESAYGGPKAFKDFVKAAHRAGFAVILDVVYNHFGPGDLAIWQFDGVGEPDRGGIYFFQDWRAETPWGHTRPDYGRGEVRQYIRDNALMWLDEFRVDGLRMDMTLYIRSVRADGEPNLPEGFSLMQWINEEIHRHHPQAITIAEDLQDSEIITKAVAEGGAGFSAQWDSRFVHPVREAIITPDDANRSMASLRDSIQFKYNNDAFRRIVYTESHDEVANGKARVPQEINPAEPTGWWAIKRSTLGAALVMTAPGIPMIFQGQEFLEGEWFRDTVPVHWDQNEEFRGIVKMYRDLIRLRRNLGGESRGLCGQHVHVIRADDANNVIAFRRWMDGGPGDDVVIVANFQHEPRNGYSFGFPVAGRWRLAFNSDAKSYSPNFSGAFSTDLDAVAGDCDGLPAYGIVDIAAYTVHIYVLPAVNATKAK